MPHSPEEKKKVLDRVRRIRGQCDALDRALEAGADCGPVLQQIAAIRGAVNGLMSAVMEAHLREEFGLTMESAFEHEFMALDVEDEHHPFSWRNFRAVEPIGSLLVSAMLIIPAAAARPLARSPEAMVAATALIGSAAGLLGLGAAFRLDTPTGPTIVCAAVAIFAAVTTLGLAIRRRPA